MKPDIDKAPAANQDQIRPVVMFRVMHMIIEPYRTVGGLFADGRMFEREPGESEERLNQRAPTALDGMCKETGQSRGDC